MGKHVVKVVHLAENGSHMPGLEGGEYVWRCTCPARAQRSWPHQQEAEDAGFVHTQDAARLAAGIKGHPSLARTRDYYEEMAKDPGQPLHEQELWQQMADEITRRLNDRGTDTDEQLALDF